MSNMSRRKGARIELAMAANINTPYRHSHPNGGYNPTGNPGDKSYRPSATSYPRIWDYSIPEFISEADAQDLSCQVSADAIGDALRKGAPKEGWPRRGDPSEISIEILELETPLPEPFFETAADGPAGHVSLRRCSKASPRR
jgi:hypothetical protein